jgi:hypothetical protein
MLSAAVSARRLVLISRGLNFQERCVERRQAKILSVAGGSLPGKAKTRALCPPINVSALAGPQTGWDLPGALAGLAIRRQTAAAAATTSAPRFIRMSA